MYIADASGSYSSEANFSQPSLWYFNDRYHYYIIFTSFIDYDYIIAWRFVIPSSKSIIFYTNDFIGIDDSEKTTTSRLIPLSLSLCRACLVSIILGVIIHCASVSLTLIMITHSLIINIINYFTSIESNILLAIKSRSLLLNLVE